MWNRQGTFLIILIKEILTYHLIYITYVIPYIYIYIYILLVDLLLVKANLRLQVSSLFWVL